MKNKKIVIIFLIIILVFIVIGLILNFSNKRSFIGKVPKTIEISETYGGAPSSEEYKVDLESKKAIQKKWSVKEDNVEISHNISKKQVNDINNMFSIYGATNYEKGEEGYAGGYDDKLTVKFDDGSKLKIHTYGGKQYLKGDNKKLFEALLEYVESIFKGE